MKAEYPIENYLERIICAENNTNELQRKVVLPNNSINVMFQFGETIFENNDDEQSSLPVSCICGQLTKAKEYSCAPGSKTILIKFKPWAAGFFSDTELHEFKDQNQPLSHFNNKHSTAGILEKIFLSADKKNAVLSFLQQQFNYVPIEKSILQAINIIGERKGQVKVDELAYKVCNSKRNFERKFKMVTGLPPKKFITNVRFQNCLQFLQAGKKLNDIAYECGYYDQSHFINEFRSITNITPDNAPKLCRIFPMNTVFITSSLQYTGLSK